jgi:hypothetical protein
MYTTYPVDFDETKAADVVAWKLARSAIEHENNLINHRMMWFFTTQAFLLSAFFGVLTSSETSFLRLKDNAVFLPIIISLIGFLALFMCAATSRSLEQGFLANDRITRHYVALAKANNFKRMPPLHAWGKPGILHTSNIPRFTILIWIALEILCAVAFITASGSPFKSFQLETYLAFASMLVSICGVATHLYLWKLRSANAAREPRYWHSDPHGQFFNPDA